MNTVDIDNNMIEWKTIESIPKDREVLVLTINQGKVKTLIKFDNIHKVWMNKGDRAYIHQWTHWCDIPLFTKLNKEQV